MNKKIFLVLLTLTLMIHAVNATTYEASITTYRPDNINDLDNSTWSKYDTITLEPHEKKTSIHQLELLDLSIETDTIFLEIIKDGERHTVFITVGEKIIIEDFQIGLNSIKEKSGTGIITTGNNVVKLWISPNSADQLGLIEGGSNTFNPVEYGKTLGWSSTGSTEEVELNIEKLVDNDGILLTIEGGDYEEISSSINKRTFLLQDNTEYIFTIDYEKTDTWGGIRDEQEVYTLTISGLSGSSSTVSGENVLLGSFSDITNRNIILETSTDGTFTESADYVVSSEGQNSNGNYVWKIRFNTAGTKRVDFTGNNGMTGYFNFVISPEVTNIEAQQSTSTDESENNNLGYGLLAVAGILGIIAVGIIVNKKRSTPKTPMGELNA